MDVVRPSSLAAMDRKLARRPAFRPALITLGVLALSAATLAWLTMAEAKRSLRIDAAKLTIAPVVEAPFHDFIPMRGQVVPLDSVVLDAVLGGRVEEVLVEAGQRVAAGQPLLRLSDPTLELNAIAGETQVIQQINEQRSLQLSFEQTRTGDAKAVADADYNILRLDRQVGRRGALAAKGIDSQEMLDQVADELRYQKRLKEIAADAEERDSVVIKRSEELIDQTARRLDDNLAAAKRQLDALIVHAPVDGVLTSLDAHLGEEKLRGQNLGQIDRDSGFKLQAPVDEYYLTRVKLGQKVMVTLDGIPSTLVVAKVYPQVKDGKFTIDLTWDGDEPGGLRRGQALQGKLELGGDVPALTLPAGPFLEAQGGAEVFVVSPDGRTADRRAVKLGRRTVDAVEVLGGLKQGERVVTSDYAGLDRIDRLAIEF